MITRRALGAALAAAVAGRAVDSFEVGGDFRANLDAYLTEEATRCWKERSARVAALRTPADVRARSEFIRNWMIDALGGLPAKTPLNPRVTGTLERDGYRVEKLVYESLPRFYVTANVYVPSGGDGARRPAVLGVAGHSDSGKAIATYQHAWISLAKKGFVVLAFDPPGQGERLEYFDPAQGKSTVGTGTREHIMAGLQCLLTGTTFARYEIQDGIRGIDYLLTRPDVDPDRIGIAGNSGGGTQAAYLAAVEPRLAAAVSSCYITSWETLWAKPGPQDSEQILPNFLADGLDFGDFLISFAPRPIQMTTAVRDFFPIAGARATYEEARRTFAVADAPGRVGYFEYDDEHGWSLPRREAAYRWLARWLQDREESGTEPPHQVEAEADLNATPTGQAITSYGGETVHSLNRVLAEEIHANRAALRLNPAELRTAIRKRLRIPPAAGRPQVTAATTGESGGLNISALRIRTEPGIEIPAVLILPPAKRRSAAVIWIDSAGKSAARKDLLKLAAAGEAVLAIDVRGFGESGLEPGRKGYTPEYQRAMRALLVGKTMLGMQTTDALVSFRYLSERPEVDSSRIRIAGRGHGGIVAQIAGALEPAIAGVRSEGALKSWMELARSQTHEGMVNLIVPGVLRDFDLPDLARLIAPRALDIVSESDAYGRIIG